MPNKFVVSSFVRFGTGSHANRNHPDSTGGKDERQKQINPYKTEDPLPAPTLNVEIIQMESFLMTLLRWQNIYTG